MKPIRSSQRNPVGETAACPPARGSSAHRPGRRIVHRYTQNLTAPPERVFPLICPVREADWLHDWAYDMVFSSTGVAEKGCVFLTGAGEPDEDVWVISTHDPARHLVEMTRISRADYVCLIRVALAEAGSGARAEISYTFTALSERGSRVIEERHSPQRFHEMVTLWERSMNHYLQTGRCLAPDPAST
jgi:hypothetical protein